MIRNTLIVLANDGLDLDWSSNPCKVGRYGPVFEDGTLVCFGRQCQIAGLEGRFRYSFDLEY